MSQDKVEVIIEKDEHGYYAYCPQLDGCQSQADTVEEALDNIKEAIDLYFETISEEEKSEYLSREIFTTTLRV